MVASQTCQQIPFDLTSPSILMGQGQPQGPSAGGELGICGSAQEDGSLLRLSLSKA